MPDTPFVNERGERIGLDETALLACANNQFAWVALLQGNRDTADPELATAATRAAASLVPEVAALAPELRAAAARGDDEARATAQRFLDLCRERGFET
ncbi:MAG: hypothetical protein OEY23_26335 [Acidimicrobiia bacterium]|nr:hypothetical protein [Acidimicrobiia bacterium]